MTYENIWQMTADYYDQKLSQYGETPQGVDWNGQESQYIRFEQLAKVIIHDRSKPFSINDVGCGYGEFIKYLNNHFSNFSYHGYDVSKKMLDAARKKFPFPNIKLHNSPQPVLSDYTVASGIFNVRNEVSNDDWQKYILHQMNLFYAQSNKGFATNFLTKYSDHDKMRNYLFYTDPMEIFDYCKQNFSRNVALLHDYDLYEFTIIVRK